MLETIRIHEPTPRISAEMKETVGPNLSRTKPTGGPTLAPTWAAPTISSAEKKKRKKNN